MGIVAIGSVKRTAEMLSQSDHRHVLLGLDGCSIGVSSIVLGPVYQASDCEREYAFHCRF